MRHAVRLNRTCEALKFSQIVPIAHRFPRLRAIIKNVVTANKLSRYEHHRGISKPLQPGNGDLEVRPIAVVEGQQCAPARQTLRIQDRKSTRLNSSHGYISYAVFCLKK